MKQDIWEDDKLGRREEARALERFLVTETQGLIEAGFEHSYVLGIDSPYGVGKTWFLRKLKDHLGQKNFPVALVDAWADDAGNEPMVAIMASVEEALKPYFRTPRIKAAVFGAIGSLGTILAKGSKAAAAKGFAKYIGEEAKDEIVGALKDAVYEASEAGAEGVVDAIGDSVDKLARNAIDSYQRRKKSVAHFKQQLLKVQRMLSKTRTVPIFVIVDELDRCRPTYAIKLLEEIKDLFDVQGLVFVIALHGRQLEKAIGAVYGSDFESADYLRRFFTSKYRLSEPSMVSLANHYFEKLEIDSRKMIFPLVAFNLEWVEGDPALVLGKLFGAMNVNSRTAISIMRGLRLFTQQWDRDYPFDLIPVATAIWNSLTTDAAPSFNVSWPKADNDFAFKTQEHSSSGWFSAQSLCNSFTNLGRVDLVQYFNETAHRYNNNGLDAYLRWRFLDEFQKRQTANQWMTPSQNFSYISEYSDRVNAIAQFMLIEKESEKEK